MRRIPLGAISMILFVISISLLIASMAVGDGEIGIFLIFPFITVFGPLGLAAGVFMLLAILALFVSFFLTAHEGEVRGDSARPDKKFGGFVLIGPIPIVFGSDGGVAKKMLWLGVGLLIAMLAIFLVLFHPFV